MAAKKVSGAHTTRVQAELDDWVRAASGISGVWSAGAAVLARRCWRGGVEFEVCKHEVDEHLPAVEVEIAGQGLHIVEEGLAGGEFNSHASILFVAEIEHGVKQERQQVEHHEYQRQVLLTVAEVAAGPDGNRSS